MKLITFPKVRQMIDEFTMWYPMMEFGPGHIVLSDYNVQNHHIYFCLDAIEKLFLKSENERINHTSDYTTENLDATREFLKELLAIEEIVRDVSIEIYTGHRAIKDGYYWNNFIYKLVETDIDKWVYEIDFTFLYDFDFDYYKQYYDILNQSA